MKLEDRHGGTAAVGEYDARKRVLLDLTTAWNWRGRKPVGIIRTERELALRLMRDPSLTVLPFLFHGGRLHVVDPAFAQNMLIERSPPVEAQAQAASTAPLPAPRSNSRAYRWAFRCAGTSLRTRRAARRARARQARRLAVPDSFASSRAMPDLSDARRGTAAVCAGRGVQGWVRRTSPARFVPCHPPATWGRPIHLWARLGGFRVLAGGSAEGAATASRRLYCIRHDPGPVPSMGVSEAP